MEIKYGKKEIETLVANYYEKVMGIQNPKAVVSTSKESVGYGMREREGAVTRIKVTGKKEIAGMASNIDVTVTDDDLKNILNEMLKSDGYLIERLSFDNGINQDTVGFGMAEKIVSKSYFKGVNVSIKKINEIEEKGKTL